MREMWTRQESNLRLQSSVVKGAPKTLPLSYSSIYGVRRVTCKLINPFAEGRIPISAIRTKDTNKI